MKYFFSILFIFSFIIVDAQKSIPKPNPPRLVNDNAGLLNKLDADALERKLVALDDSTGNQIVVLTIPSLNGEILEDVAVNTFRDWGIGGKENNNGILLLIALQDRKIRIEVGYGLEGAIPDVVANDIIKNDLTPAFKEGNYLSGITKAVDDLSKAAVGEYKVKRKKNNDEVSGKDILVFIIILFIVLMIVGRSGSGGGGGNMMNRRGSSDIARNLFWLNLLNSGRGGSGGGGWSGGGGGFGGFGGGSSGGGGASGGW
ncbi:MAG: TPM domain-containing protein [Chitinophagales bacterium]|nr:TPM domain-containing protein [Chitinophagales bacterium]